MAAVQHPTDRVMGVAFSLDGTLLAGGGEAPGGWGELFLWDAPAN